MYLVIGDVYFFSPIFGQASRFVLRERCARAAAQLNTYTRRLWHVSYNAEQEVRSYSGRWARECRGDREAKSAGR